MACVTPFLGFGILSVQLDLGQVKFNDAVNMLEAVQRARHLFPGHVPSMIAKALESRTTRQLSKELGLIQDYINYGEDGLSSSDEDEEEAHCACCDHSRHAQHSQSYEHVV